ncbi:MAG TPA: GAF domain-containing sensor histidine kinase [Anaerolineaceae bacterium]
MNEGVLTREQLEERLATLHRASLELVKNISLDTLLERIAALACEQVLAQYAAVGILDNDGKLEKFIPIGMNPEAIQRMAHPPVGIGLIGALMNATEPIRLADIKNDPRSTGFPPHHPEMTSFLGVPIRMGDKQFGQIYLTNKLTGPEFTADDERVIETFAAYAAVAISNARFYQQIDERDQVLTRRNENMALVNELASVLAISEDSTQVLDQVLTRVMEYLRLDVGEVYLRQEDGRILQLALHRGEIIHHLWASQTFQFGEGLVGKTALTGQLTQVDLEAEIKNKPNHNGHYLHADALTGELKQLLCLPLSGRSGVLGVLCVGSCSSDPLDDLEMQFLSAISAWVGMGLENLRLNVQQRRLAVLEERERIGMDLHDGIIQDIYAVGLTLEHARLLMSDNPQAAKQRIEQAINDLNSTIRDIRAYILDLRPRKLNEENLVDGLHRLIAEFRANTLIEVTMQSPAQGLRLPQSQATALFHICQEALANVGKHSRARHVTVSLWTTSDRALLEISDNGRGFDQNTTRSTLGHGLSNMQTRASNAGGELEISSEPDQGTTVLAWLPYTNED